MFEEANEAALSVLLLNGNVALNLRYIVSITKITDDPVAVRVVPLVGQPILLQGAQAEDLWADVTRTLTETNDSQVEGFQSGFFTN